MENEDKTMKELKELSEGVDRDAMKIGLTISDVFQTVSLAAIHLPEMELRTEHMVLTFDGDAISVKISGLSAGCRHKYEDEGFDEYSHNDSQDDEEEGLIYDEI